MKLKSVAAGFPLPLSILLWTAVCSVLFVAPAFGPALFRHLTQPWIWFVLLLNLAWSSALALPVGVQVAVMSRNSLRNGSLGERLREALLWGAAATAITSVIAVAVIPRSNTRLVEFRYELQGQEVPAQHHRSDRELTLSELLQRMDRAAADPNGDPRFRNALRVEFAKKFTIPLLCMFLAFTAVVVGTVLSTVGKARVPLLVLVNCLLLFVCWVLLIQGERHGDSGALPAVVAALLPHIALGVLGSSLLGRARATISPEPAGESR